jgi:hypothetical protein
MSEKAVASRMEEQSVKTTVNGRELHLGKNEWHETNLLYFPKRNFDGEIEEGHERYVVFMWSEPVFGSVEAHIGLYNDRQEIEAGYKQVKRFMAKTTSTDFVLRFFLFGVRVFAVLAVAADRSPRAGMLHRLVHG